MAGALVAIERETQGKSVTSIGGGGGGGGEWEVQYSRFFHYPFLSSACPSTTPLSDSQRRRFKGTWLSSSSWIASLKLIASGSETALVVTLRHKIQEEHYISKLHFSWPQVSCVSGFPPRGSRVVFASYKDCAGQIQKFALRFFTIYDTERFIDSLKEMLEYESITHLSSGGVGSEISSQSEFVPSNEPPYRPWEDSSFMTSAGTCSQDMPQTLNTDVVQLSNAQDTNLNCDAENIYSALPPSFTSLLTHYCPDLSQAAAEPAVPEHVDLKFQITKYLEDSSFQDMLSKVERVISELGGDLML